jgi:hypothetical protein
MKPFVQVIAILALTVAACGDGEDPTDNPDGGAPLGGVALVSCPASPAVTFTTPANRFEPVDATIDVGEIVRFDLSAGHDVASSQSGLFSVPLGGERCFRFDQAGTYGFRCVQHGFTGSLVVQ